MVRYSAHCIPLRSFPSLAELKLSGIGFRGYSYLDRGVFNLGYSHYLCVWSPRRLKVKRQRLLLYRPDLHRFHQLRPSDPYRGRGIRNPLVVQKLKEGKKR